MGPMTLIAVYLTIWWTVLFAVLPLGAQSFSEAGIAPPPGADPGAPVNPNLKRKFITTTWVSAIVWAVIMVLLYTRWLPLPTLPGGPN